MAMFRFRRRDDAMRNGFARLASAAILCGAMTGAAQAQEVFSAGSNTSNRTGTQGVVGNPNCPPPVRIVNGRRVTPLNWSCDSSGYWASQAPNMKAPSGPPHPGPAYVPGAANPCQPGGPGGYNWLANPVGTRLPPGCVRAPGRAFTTAKRDSYYDSIPAGSYLRRPAGPPGSYIQPDGRPGNAFEPPPGPPGTYLQPDGRPGSYLESTAKNDPNGSKGLTHDLGPLTPSSGIDPAAKDGLGRQDTGAMRPESFNAGPQAGRVHTGAVRARFTGGPVLQKPAKAPAARTTPAKKIDAAAAARADVVRRMKIIMDVAAGSGH
jgi:hypothetical protein